MVAIGGYYDQYPYMLYRGVELKKDGTPTNMQENTEMHQINIGKPRI
jgi:hypothetical protein